MEKETLLEVYWRLALRIVLLITGIFILFYFVKSIIWVIGLLVVSVLIVYTLAPVTAFLNRLGIPNTISALIVFTLLICALVLFFSSFIPSLLAEMRSLVTYLSTDYNELWSQFMEYANKLLESDTIVQALRKLSEDLPRNIQTAIITLTVFTRNIFSRLFEIVIVLFLVFYLLRDLRKVKQAIVSFFPESIRQEAAVILGVLDQKVGAYLRGNVLRCLLVGVMTFIALELVGMPFALMLGILAGLLNIIVYVGPYLAGLPAVLLALAPGTPHPLLIIAIYVLIQGIEAFLLSPLLLGKAVDLMPFTVIVSLLIGGQLFGFLGILLAIPVAAALKVILYRYCHGVDCTLSSTARPSQALVDGCRSVVTKLHRLETTSLYRLFLDLLVGLGVFLIVSPALLFWLLHGSTERYSWLISGPYPFNRLGSGPVQFWLSLALLVCGILLLLVAGFLKKHLQKRKSAS
ncbi:MAG: AI-2E family transporter [Firmicutes bacterium]|nr:AI-2E family transporter [Bacillota bacterium]